MDDRSSRTISLCTGMQSSTLAMLLATQFFGTTAAVPPACSVVFMALSGLSLATFWGRGYKVRHMLKAFAKHMYLSKENHADEGKATTMYA
jgi:BASS family bile acid:Na+ symporter